MTTAIRSLERTKVKQILFSGPMVRAILNGRKTMTRRVLSPHTAFFSSAPNEFWSHADLSRAFVDGEPEHGQHLHVPCHAVECERCLEMGWDGTSHRLWPQYEPGDLLWVGESFHAYHWDRPRAVYRADYADKTCRVRTQIESYEVGKWSPSIHMPRWASRITLEVTGVKVERLQEISEEDALAEGFTFHALASGDIPAGAHPIHSFRKLWDSLNAKRGYGWDDNPYVTVVQFSVFKLNVDEVLRDRKNRHHREEVRPVDCPELCR